MPLSRIIRNGIRPESGATLLETVVALAVLGTVAVTFLTGIYTTSKAAFLADTRATAMSLAQSQMEWAENTTYSYNATATGYPPAPIPSGKDYIGYSANITATLVSGHSSDDGIQKITVTIKRSGADVIKLEGYKRHP